jgi:hypothetical protein
VLDCQSRVELHGIKMAAVTQWGVYAARSASVEAHGLDLRGSASGLWFAKDCARAALYDSRLNTGANAWNQVCRDSIAERLYMDNGSVLIEDATLGSAIVTSRNATANAVKFHGGTRAQAKINANAGTVPSLVLDSVGKFDTLGLAGTATSGRCVTVSGGTVADLSGMTMTSAGGAGNEELLIDGVAETFADAVNFLQVTGGISRVITGGTGLQKDMSQGFALNSEVVGGAAQQYGPELLLPSVNTPSGAGLVLTAHAGGGQGSATKLGYRFTQATAANDGDSMKLLGAGDIFATIIYETRGVNVGTHTIALFPPSGTQIYLAGAAQGTNNSVNWTAGKRLEASQDVSGNWWVNFI